MLSLKVSPTFAAVYSYNMESGDTGDTDHPQLYIYVFTYTFTYIYLPPYFIIIIIREIGVPTVPRGMSQGKTRGLSGDTLVPPGVPRCPPFPVTLHFFPARWPMYISPQIR